MKRIFISITAAGALIASVALAEQIYVNAAYVEIRSDKDSISEVVAKVPKGKPLNALGHEGRWIKAETVEATPVKQGYVYDAAISPSQPDMTGFTGSTEMTTVDAANAGKGLEPNAKDYSQKKNLNPKPLQGLLDARAKLIPAEWKTFMAEGQVGVSNPHQ